MINDIKILMFTKNTQHTGIRMTMRYDNLTLNHFDDVVRLNVLGY